jgi:hypothetical protein
MRVLAGYCSFPRSMRPIAVLSVANRCLGMVTQGYSDVPRALQAVLWHAAGEATLTPDEGT